MEINKDNAVARALGAIVLDPKISAWLAENDPKALEQARRALAEEGELPSAKELVTLMSDFAPNHNLFPEKHKDDLSSALWSICRREGCHGLAEAITSVGNKMRALQWRVLGKPFKFSGGGEDGA